MPRTIAMNFTFHATLRSNLTALLGRSSSAGYRPRRRTTLRASFPMRDGLADDQIAAVAKILAALGEVSESRRTDTLAVACRVYIDHACRTDDRPHFRRLMEAVGLDRGD